MFARDRFRNRAKVFTRQSDITRRDSISWPSPSARHAAVTQRHLVDACVGEHFAASGADARRIACDAKPPVGWELPCR